MAPDALTPDEYATLREAAATDRSALVVRLGGEAGLRTSEIPRVRPADLRSAVDATGDAAADAPAARVLAVPDGDGGTDRHVVVPAALADAVERYAEDRGIDSGEPLVDLSQRRIQMLVAEAGERAAERAGRDRFRDVTPRTLRGTFARRLLVEEDVDPRIVRAVGGWETLDALDPHLPDPSEAAVVAALADGEPDTEADGTGADEEGTTAGEGGTTASEESTTAGEGGTAAGEDRAPLGDEGPEPGRSPSDAGPGWLAAAIAAAVDATDRAELLAAVPAALTEDPRWDAAWTATREGRAGPLSVADAAGEAAPLEAARESDGGGGRGGGTPWTAALDRGEPVVGTVVTDDAERPALAVPIAYEGATAGVCCAIAAGEPPTERERRALALVGRVAGRGLTALRWRDLLHSDAVLRLEFRTSDARAFLPALTDRLDCTVELESTVVVSDAELLCYLSIEGARPPAIADVVAAVDGIAEPRVVETREDGCRLSVVVSGGSPVRALTRRGATIAEATAADGRLRVVAEVPAGTDVGPIADGLRASFPDARLVGRQVVDAPPTTGSQLRETVTERFTDRQRTALEAAYESGYFDWPRDSTAEEVADAMGVSSPTFHNHLRKAQRELLEAVFER